jgi:nucleotide sugar dehydrogenase
MDNISVVGIGKLGLCFALSLEKAGYRVVGVDIYEEYVDSINAKTFESSEAFVNDRLRESKNFVATQDLDEALRHSDVVFAVVATPSLEDGRYDHFQVDTLVEELIKRGRQDTSKHLVINCTTMPQYCLTLCERLGKYNWTVSYNPEFIAQGSIIRDQENPDMVLIGEGSPEAGDLIESIYDRMTENSPRICRMTPTEAEITKISLNCFLTTKIAYTNMIGDIVKKSGGDPQTVLNAIGADSRVGKKLTRYGFGYGGPCFPRDNRALAIYAGDIDVPAEISVATDTTNANHLKFQLADFILNHTWKETVAFGAKEHSQLEADIWFESVTYKEGSTIIEESQQLAFAVTIARIGYVVIVSDRLEVLDSIRREYGELFIYEERV